MGSIIWSLAKQFVGPAIVALVIAIAGGIAIWQINNNAFNRGEAKGIAETTAAMTKAVNAMKKAAVDNALQRRNLTPDQLDDELKKRCIAECAGDKQCIAACQ